MTQQIRQIAIFLMVMAIAGTRSWGAWPPSGWVMDPAYSNAVVNASNYSQLPVADNLTWIWDSSHNPNPFLEWSNNTEWVKVSVFTRSSYTNSYNVGGLTTNSWGMIWVATTADFKGFFGDTNYYQPSVMTNVYRRVEQLLGLPNDYGSSNVVELFVHPQDLARPAWDYQTTNHSVAFGWPNPMPTVPPPGFASVSDYTTWFTNRLDTIYTFSSNSVGYPWTGLGYTYDWYYSTNDLRRIGPPEFILGKNSAFYTTGIYELPDYVQAVLVDDVIAQIQQSSLLKPGKKRILIREINHIDQCSRTGKCHRANAVKRAFASRLRNLVRHDKLDTAMAAWMTACMEQSIGNCVPPT
ncbi:MAG: hypothetical protein ABSC38_01270 [Verrucomicrobiia bacterium]